MQALTTQVVAALGRAAQLFDGPLGHRPDVAAKIELKQRSLAEALADVQGHRADPTYHQRVNLHLHRLRGAAAEVHALIQDARGQ